MGSFTVITVKETAITAITATELKRHLLIHDTNEFITQNQWPRDAAMGRLNDSGKNSTTYGLIILGS